MLESDEQSTWVDPYKNEINKIRKLCADLIWSACADERLWGPRFGVILISILEASNEKVCFIRDIIEIEKESQIFV